MYANDLFEIDFEMPNKETVAFNRTNSNEKKNQKIMNLLKSSCIVLLMKLFAFAIVANDLVECRIILESSYLFFKGLLSLSQMVL